MDQNDAQPGAVRSDVQEVVQCPNLIDRDLAAYRPVALGGTSKLRSVEAVPKHMRVPRCAETPSSAIRLWLRFLYSQLSDSAPVLLLLPLRSKFIDVVVGEPTREQFFCLQAGEAAIPRSGSSSG